MALISAILIWVLRSLRLSVISLMPNLFDVAFKPRHRLRGGAVRGVTHDETGTGRYQCPL